MKMGNRSILCVLASLCGSTLAAAEDRVGRFYEISGPAEGKPLFTQKIRREKQPNGKRVSESTIEDPEGNVVMRETAVLEGSKILSQKIDQLQINEAYELESKGEEVVFRTFKLMGDKRELLGEKRVRRDPEFLTGPATEPFLKEKLSGKESGHKVLSEFGIFELEKSVSFEFSHRGFVNDGKVTKVRLQPDSFWLSFLVQPIDMEFDSNSFVLLKYKGRTPVRRKVNGTWKAFDALILYAEK